MSYARFGENSNVYVYAHVGGFVECCGCALGDEWDFHSPTEVVTHMQEHKDAGHKVPEHLFDLSLYPPDDFVAMCGVFLCRNQTGHDGEHTPIRGRSDDETERFQVIRDRVVSTSKEQGDE